MPNLGQTLSIPSSQKRTFYIDLSFDVQKNLKLHLSRRAERSPEGPPSVTARYATLSINRRKNVKIHDKKKTETPY